MAYVSKETKAELAPGIKAVLKKYGMKGTISVNHYSTLVVKVRSGSIDFGTTEDVNVYHIDTFYEGTAKKFLTELLAAMKGDKWFDKSDSMVDYFHTAWYNDIKIGDWNKPYELKFNHFFCK